jgi:hypothetical protein
LITLISNTAEPYLPGSTGCSRTQRTAPETSRFFELIEEDWPAEELARAQHLAATLAAALPACGPAIVTDLGPVLGVHLGPGALGVVVALEG